MSTDVMTPVAPIVVVALVAGLAAVAGAWLPARRAGRFGILDVIAL